MFASSVSPTSLLAHLLPAVGRWLALTDCMGLASAADTSSYTALTQPSQALTQGHVHGNGLFATLEEAWRQMQEAAGVAQVVVFMVATAMHSMLGRGLVLPQGLGSSQRASLREKPWIS